VENRTRFGPVTKGFRKSPQQGQRAVAPIVLATMPAIAKTGAMLFTGRKDTSGKSVQPAEPNPRQRLANTRTSRQVSGTSHCAEGVVNCFLQNSLAASSQRG